MPLLRKRQLSFTIGESGSVGMLPAKRELLGRAISLRRRIALAAAALAGFAMLLIDGGASADRMLRSSRDSLRSHAASGEIHIVEIDARSLRALDQWPWPRRYHAELIDRLRQSGARSIAFDVNFSALSNPLEDAALASALERAGGSVVLPTLRQQAGAGSSDHIDSLPATPFRNHAFLGVVTIHADDDGNVRQMPLGMETAGTPRPSLATLVAEQQAEIGRGFDIDYSIDPATIPRHSFVDVVQGRLPAGALEGRRVIVGATAVDLGDRYAVPRHGIIPGVVIQALAAETLLGGRVPRSANGLFPLLLAMALVGASNRIGSAVRRTLAFAAGTGLVLALPLVGEQFFALSFPLAPALAAIAAAVLLSLALHLVAKFRSRARADEATGLPNLKALQAAIDPAGGVVVVALIERFAAIAAGLGPEATATLVQRIAERLHFPSNPTIYRTDEGSLAWIEPCGDPAALEERLDALAALMRSPIDCGRRIDVDLTFGTAGQAKGGPGQQIANAALAADQARRRGARRARFEWIGDESDWHLSLLGELDDAMAAGDLWVAYQPKLDLDSGRISGVEALVRWSHPKRGLITPDQFIPHVEENGRARDLTLHVFDQALRDTRRWQREGHQLGVAVNVSATLLSDPAFVPLIRDRLEAVALPRGTITIEITESAAMRDPDTAIAALAEWRSLGLLISIDDYGTGQSSLGYLQKLPATELKIDRSFIAGIATDVRDAIMVRSTIALAHELNIKVVAEGVEEAECLAELRAMGCDTVQGWLVGRPMPASALGTFLSKHLRTAA